MYPRGSVTSEFKMAAPIVYTRFPDDSSNSSMCSSVPSGHYAKIPPIGHHHPSQQQDGVSPRDVQFDLGEEVGQGQCAGFEGHGQHEDDGAEQALVYNIMTLGA